MFCWVNHRRKPRVTLRRSSKGWCYKAVGDCGFFLGTRTPGARPDKPTWRKKIGKNHHFVPQFYFRRFSTDGHSICALTRKEGKFARLAPIKNQASKSDFYGSEETEKVLSQIEGECSTALKKLCALDDPTQLSEDDVSSVLRHISLQRSRTVAARQKIQQYNDKLYQLFLEVELNNDESLDEHERQKRLTDIPEAKADPAMAQMMQMQAALEFSEHLRDLVPLLLHNKTNRPFIFSDAPAIFYNLHYRDVRHRGVLGMDTPGLIVILPLSSEKNLLLLDHACYRVKQGARNRINVRELSDVMALNKLQLHSSTNCVYFQDFKFSQYVTEIWKLEKGRLAPPKGMVIEAPGFDAATGEAMGEILHGFEPQLPYALSLTFLEHDVFGDIDYRFSRRSER
jgi:hypothetical protein